ncbi:MAG: autotransporter-associated beta strand repeat-containing protein [Kiritimatiellae bacterium]|nr:autotransporter-associated beta strand repeat-containing protein [Kiritimatiellia bacterium]
MATTTIKTGTAPRKAAWMGVVCAFAGLAACAVTKPLAVWNGDFPVDGTDERNGFVLNPNGNTSDGAKITFAASSGAVPGGIVVTNSAATLAQASGIVRIANIPAAVEGHTNLVIGAATKNSNSRVMVGFDETGTIGAYSAAPQLYANSKEAWTLEDTATHSIGVKYVPASGTYGYVDGEEVLFNSSLKWSSGSSSDVNLGQGITVGGFAALSTNPDRFRPVGAEVSLIVVGDSFTTEDMAYWQLQDMTSVENAQETIVGGEGVGVNLAGGTIAIESDTAAYALFVQEDTTLEIPVGVQLTLAGPLYVAQGKRLTLKAMSLPENGETKTLVSYEALFGDVTGAVADGLDRGDGWNPFVQVGEESVTITLSKSVPASVVAAGDAAVTGIAQDATISNVDVGGTLKLEGSGTITLAGPFRVGGALEISEGIDLRFTSGDEVSFPAGTAFNKIEVGDASKIIVTGDDATIVTDAVLFSYDAEGSTVPTPVNHRFNTSVKNNTDVAFITEDGRTSVLVGWRLTWIGDDGAAMDNKARWQHSDGTAAEGYPNDASVAGDHIIIPAGAVVDNGSHDIAASVVELLGDVKITGSSTSGTFALRANSILGDGTITLGEKGALACGAQALSVANDIKVEGTEENPAVLLVKSSQMPLTVSRILGTGALSCRCGNNVNYTGVHFTKSFDGFTGTIMAPANNQDRNQTQFGSDCYGSANVAFKGMALQGGNFCEKGSNTYRFGSFQGKGCFASPTSPNNVTVEIGALGAEDDAFAGQMFSTTYPSLVQGRGHTIRKVGEGTLDASAYLVKAWEANGGTLKFSSMRSLKTMWSGNDTIQTEDANATSTYKATIKFAGEGGVVALGDDIDNAYDISAQIVASTAPIGYDTGARDWTWATALPACGGIVKRGSGKLTLADAANAKGPLVVEDGELAMPVGGVFTQLQMGANAKLTLDMAAITEETADGVIFAPAIAAGTTVAKGQIELANAPEGVGLTAYVNDAGTVVVIYKGNPRTLVWQGSAEDALWSNAANWLDGGEVAALAPTSIDSVQFPAGASVQVAEATEVFSITALGDMTIANDDSLTVVAAVEVTGGLVKNGAGTLAVGGGIEAGSVTVKRGEVYGIGANGAVKFEPVALAAENYKDALGAKIVLTDARTLTDFGTAGVIESSADLTYDVAGSATFSGTISGAGGFAKTGDGTLTLIGTNTFSGALSIEGGTLKLGTITDIPNPRYNLDASAEGAFEKDEDGNITGWNSTIGNAGYYTFNHASGAYITAGEGDLIGNRQAARFAPDYADAMHARYTNYSANWSNDSSETLFVAYYADSDIDKDARLWGQGGSSNRAIAYRSGNNTWYWAADSNKQGGFFMDGEYGNLVSRGRDRLLAVVDLSAVNGRGSDKHDHLGATTDTGKGFKGLIGQVTAFKRVLTMEERRAAEAYLMAKWNIGNVKYSVIPETAAVTLANGSRLDLGGLDVAVASLTGNGTVENGTLTTADGKVTMDGDLEVPAVAGMTYYVDSAEHTLVLAGDATGCRIVLPEGYIGGGVKAVQKIYAEGAPTFVFPDGAAWKVSPKKENGKTVWRIHDGGFFYLRFR